MGLPTDSAWTVLVDRVTPASYGPTPQVGQGTTAQRPAGLPADGRSFQFYDTTLGKPVWFNGTVWKDATGATV
jgi:hypothetical protein